MASRTSSFLRPIATADLRRSCPNADGFLQDSSAIFGALRVDLDEETPWSPGLEQRLQQVAMGLAHALVLDLETLRLSVELSQQQDQLRMLLHQLRNPLAALRTCRPAAAATHGNGQ